jgi:hypothetical protein
MPSEDYWEYDFPLADPPELLAYLRKLASRYQRATQPASEEPTAR